MYKKQRAMYENSDSVVSSMIWGSEWDRVMRWFQSFGGETGAYVTNSTGKGNYGTSSTIATGTEEAYKAKNIYDMAGNAFEWTIESYGTSFRVIRRRFL